MYTLQLLQNHTNDNVIFKFILFINIGFYAYFCKENIVDICENIQSKIEYSCKLN